MFKYVIEISKADNIVGCEPSLKDILNYVESLTFEGVPVCTVRVYNAKEYSASIRATGKLPALVTSWEF